LTGSTFTSGTGGSSSAPNLAQAAMEGVIALKMIELDPARKLNPDKTVITRCTHTMAASGGTNATFSRLLEFPIEVIPSRWGKRNRRKGIFKLMAENQIENTRTFRERITAADGTGIIEILNCCR
jgi:hypothetical protein